MMKKGATWTMNGVMIPEETKKKKSRFKLSKRFKYVQNIYLLCTCLSIIILLLYCTLNCVTDLKST